jgi:hypothetical protein
MGINHVGYETCDNLYDGDIAYSVMLFVQVCLVAVKIVAKVTLRSHFRSGNTQSKDWIDATISELGRLTGILETSNSRDSVRTLVAGQIRK